MKIFLYSSSVYSCHLFLISSASYGETVETVSDFILGGSKITADGDCSQEIKRCLLLGRKIMTNLDSILKSRDITSPTKVSLVKAMVFPVSCVDVRVGLWRKLSTKELMLLNCGVGEDSWESLGLQGDPISPFWRRSALGFLWKEWCLKLKLQYCGHLMRIVDSLEKTLMLGGIGGRGEGDNRGWDGWMASLTRWTWVWVNSGSWWWTGRPGGLWFMGSQRVRHNWAPELNWIEQCFWEHMTA